MSSHPGWNVWLLGAGNRTAALLTGAPQTITISGPDQTLGNQTPPEAVSFKFNPSITLNATYAGTATVDGGEGFYATVGPRSFFITQATVVPGQTAILNPGGDFVVCFMPGTLIATPEGERPVESLVPGDLVLTAGGAAKPVVWVGRQTVCRLFGTPADILPIRIRAGALGENLPARDLLVSPAHAVKLGEILVQAGALVNGVSVVQETDVPEVFTYHHIELPEHDLLVAEGVPAESFIDNLDPGHFDNIAERPARAEDSFLEEMDLPRAKSVRQVPRALRAFLLDRANALYGGVTAEVA